MKRFLLYLSAALSTFLIGLFLTTFWNFLTFIPDLNDPETKVYGCSFSSDYVEDGIEIEYNWTMETAGGNKGVFMVTNNSDESIYYSAYERNEHVYNWIIQDGKFIQRLPVSGRSGMRQQELRPGESDYLNTNIPDKERPFDAGFQFRIGKERMKQIVWVRVNNQSKHPTFLPSF